MFKKSGFKFSIFIFLLFLLAAEVALAESNPFLKKAHVLNIFNNPLPKFQPKRTSVIDVSTKEEQSPEQVEVVETATVDISTRGSQNVLPPEQTPFSKLNPNTPTAFKAMTTAFRNGDLGGARAYAGQFVRYMKNLMWEVSELTGMVGEALVDEGQVDEEDWVGAQQMMNQHLARARMMEGSVIKPTHEDAMKRVKADPHHKAEIYFFFNLGSKYARQMAPDVERLWRVVQQDPRLKMIGLALGPTPNDWLADFRKYTGLTLPVMGGQDAAKAFRIKFVPTIVVVSPGNNMSYVKTGQQTFARLYEFVRTVQGLSVEETPYLTQLANLSIGTYELSKKKGRLVGGVGPNGYIRAEFSNRGAKKVYRKPQDGLSSF